MNFRPTKAFVNLNALAYNLQVVKTLAPSSQVLAIIKANGYGHGICRVAQQFKAADGFGVASIDEAMQLRKAGFTNRIVLLEGLFCQDELHSVIQHNLELVVHSEHQIHWILAQKNTKALSLWIKVDTGMHRLGFSLADAEKAIGQLKHSKNHFEINLMSHFSSADEHDPQFKKFTESQIAKFKQITDQYNFPKSFCNSAGLVNYPHVQYDWVRPGIMLYGAGCQSVLPNGKQLKIAMRLESEIIALHWICEGESVGYGNQWIAPKKSLIAVVAIGYGDGYPRHAQTGTPVLIQQTKVPLVGRVSMDMITVDVTAICEKVSIGDCAVLWGCEQLTVDEIAHYSGTIGYELLCGVTKRVPILEE